MLAGCFGFRPAKATREGHLATGKPRALVLPLALPEWRQAACRGELVSPDGQLELTLSAHGRALFSPLFIAPHERTLSSDSVTWRRLTVAQERRILPPDEASGFRAQLGDRQWLVYRALATRGSRTVLGLNTNYEYVVGRFDREEGVVDPLLQVE